MTDEEEITLRGLLIIHLFDIPLILIILGVATNWLGLTNSEPYF